MLFDSWGYYEVAHDLAAIIDRSGYGFRDARKIDSFDHFYVKLTLAIKSLVREWRRTIFSFT
jgi:hypothetical protein